MIRTRNTDSFDFSSLVAMVGCVNDRPIFGVPAGCLRLIAQGSGAEKRFEHNRVFWHETYVFDVSDSGFDALIYNSAGETMTPFKIYPSANFSSLADTVEVHPDADHPTIVG